MTAPIDPPRARARRVTEEAVLDAAERVIAETGVSGAAMSAIAQTAGVAVGTLYNYFGDRVGLLRALVARHRLELARAIDGAAARSEGDFESDATAFITAVFNLFDTRRDFLRAALESELWKALHEEPDATDGRVRRQLEKRAYELMLEGMKQGCLSSEADAEALAALFSGAVRGSLLHRAQHSKLPPARDAARWLTRVFIFGAGQQEEPLVSATYVASSARPVRPITPPAAIPSTVRRNH